MCPVWLHPDAAATRSNDGINHLHVADSIFQGDGYWRIVQNCFGKVITLDSVLVTHLQLQPLDFAAPLKADDTGTIVRRIERCLGQFYVTFDTRQMSSLEMSNLQGAGERRVADAEVENSRNQTVNPKMRIIHNRPEHTLRLGIEQPA